MQRHFSRNIQRIGLAALLCSVISLTVLAENWPAWRGPTFKGISSSTGLPAEWSSKKNVARQQTMPGPAGASPVVWEDRVFVTSVDNDNLVLLCISTSGKELWRRTVGTGDRKVRRDEGNMASPSPTTDGKHVWAMMGTGDLACYDFEGKEIWKIDLQKRYGKFRIAFGMASTPIVADGRLLLQLIHGDGKAATQEAIVVGIDATSGKGLWKTDRVTGATNENEHSYASPILYRSGKTSQFITHGADFTISYDPKTGKEIWRCGGLNPRNDPNKRYHPTLRFVASPVAADGMVILPTAKNQAVFAIKPNLKGDITAVAEAHLWKLTSNTPDVPSPLIHGGLVYLCRENGDLICLDGKTGTQLYRQRTHRNRHRASPVIADGKIFLTSRDGKVSVVQVGKTFKLLSQNSMNDTISASPAISNGTIYLRGWEYLWAIRKAK